MTDHFPYPILDKDRLIVQLNHLAGAGIAFLFIINYKADRGYVIRQDEMDTDYIRFQFEAQGSEPDDQNLLPKENTAESGTLLWDIHPLNLNEYEPKFNYVRQQIHRGNSFLVNLTQPSKVSTNLSLLEIYHRSRAMYKLWIKNSMLVLSPETFVTINGRNIASFPMKGTIEATIPHAREIILNDPKEMAEHATIVDLIRNDLSLVADQVEVKRYRYVETVQTNKADLLQVSSEIAGVLSGNYRDRLGDILYALLPAGSICGAPKAKTLEIIEKAEGYDRGFYTGICGYFDGENLDSGVMIRFLEQDGDQLRFKSGGGITAQSELIKEYEELIQKVYVPVF